jgi:16S rRNA (cytidine1402-2'-O)-methyltransferase
VCRELTKLHEEIARGPLATLITHFHEAPRGELTLVIEGARGLPAAPVEEAPATPLDIDVEIDQRLARGLSVREVAREIAPLAGLERREAYKRVVARRSLNTSSD